LSPTRSTTSAGTCWYRRGPRLRRYLADRGPHLLGDREPTE
jgi:hypothetical protein